MLDEEIGEVKIRDNQQVIIGGMVTDKVIKYTKTNKAMAFITVEDLVGTVEVIIFPKDYEKFSSYLEEDAKIFVQGRATVEEDKDGKIICEKIYRFEDAAQELWLKFPTKEEFDSKEEELYELMQDSDGGDEVVIYIALPRAMKRLPASRNVSINRELLSRLEDFLGKENVKVVEKSLQTIAKRRY